MNSKIPTNYNYLLNLNKNKTKQRKQIEQEQNQRNRNHMEHCQQGGGGGKMREKVWGIRSINGRYKIDRGRLRIIQGNGEAKELICTTH